MGVDRAIHVVVDDKDYEKLQPLAVAKLLAKVAEEEKADMVILGKQVIHNVLFFILSLTSASLYVLFHIQKVGVCFFLRVF